MIGKEKVAQKPQATLMILLSLDELDSNIFLWYVQLRETLFLKNSCTIFFSIKIFAAFMRSSRKLLL